MAADGRVSSYSLGLAVRAVRQIDGRVGDMVNGRHRDRRGRVSPLTVR